MALALRYAARSDVGLLRDGNEDSGYAGPRLLVIADGMGGHAAGEVASSVAVTLLSSLDEDSPGGDLLDQLSHAVRDANAHLRDMVRGDPALDGMGTTLTALLRAGSRFGLVHVGDSRGYLLRDGALQQITRDHTFVQTLVDEGRITAEEADHHPQRNLITNTVDGRDQLDLDLSVREARPGDRYLLCSDGLSGVVSEETLRDTLADVADPQEAVEQLVELALRGGGPDNVTAIVADVVEVDASPSAVPVVVGAAAEDASRRTTSGGSAAARAAALNPPRRDDDLDRFDDVAVHRHPVRRLLVALLLLALLGGGGYGAWRWSQQQYYVGVQGENVAIFRGLTQDVGPVHTSQVYEEQDIALADLPAYQQDRVRSDITANNLGDAQRIVGNLRKQRDVCRRVRAAASASASAASASAASQSAASASRAASPSGPPRPSSSPSAAANPTPSPTPSPTATGTDPGATDCGDEAP